MNDKNKEKILFVDDSTTVRKTAVKILNERYQVIEAENGEDAWKILQKDDEIRIVFTDIQMPVLNGLQLLIRLKKSEDEYLNSLPVIMITGESDSEATMRAVFEMGATDFIGKPFKSMDLLTRAYSYLQLSGKVRILDQLSGIDRLTGLNNATQFKKLGEQTLSLAVRNNIELTVAYMEVCDYQKIKLTHGDHIAAQILITIADRFKVMLRKEDIVARTGIARFSLIFPATTRVRASIIIKRIRDAIHNLSFDTGIKQFYIETAIGITAGIESQADSFDEISLLTEHALMFSSTRKDGDDMEADYRPGGATQGRRTKTNKTNDTLLTSLLHLVEGDYNKINDKHVRHILDKFNSFSEFIEKYRPTLPAEQTGGYNQ